MLRYRLLFVALVVYTIVHTLTAEDGAGGENKTKEDALETEEEQEVKTEEIGSKGITVDEDEGIDVFEILQGLPGSSPEWLAKFKETTGGKTKFKLDELDDLLKLLEPTFPENDADAPKDAEAPEELETPKEPETPNEPETPKEPESAKIPTESSPEPSPESTTESEPMSDEEFEKLKLEFPDFDFIDFEKEFGNETETENNKNTEVPENDSKLGKEEL